MHMMMRALWKLNKQSLFAPEVSLGVDVIHVLVVVPEGSDISQMVERSANVVLEALRDSTDEIQAVDRQLQRSDQTFV
jgi:hypothetical protein